MKFHHNKYLLLCQQSVKNLKRQNDKLMTFHEELIFLMRLFRILLQNQTEKHGPFNIYKTAALTASCSQCAEEGLRIFSEGGSAIDCAICTLLCAGVKHPARLGIGGGFIATIYSKKQQNVKIIIARERAPLQASPTMFKSEKEALFGGKATAIPGSLKGYWEMHTKYGKLPWKRLFEPALKMCREGIYVQPFTYFGMKQVEQDVYKTRSLRQLLVDPFSGISKPQKHKIYRHDLAKTLEIISLKNPEALYNGALTKNFVQDIKNAGGVITEYDMKNYKTKWLEPLKISIPELKINVYTAPPPSSGAVMLFILKIFSKYCNLHDNSVEQWYRYVEALKFAYGYRSKLGDPDTNPEILKTVQEMLDDNILSNLGEKLHCNTFNDCRHYGGDFIPKNDLGTFHFNFISPDGDAIAITETINTLFGALFRSKSTGIILNNTMNDFSITNNVFNVPPSAANLIAPHKIPLSSILPSLVTNMDDTQVKLAAGGAGGTRIISSVSQVLTHHLLLKESVENAVDRPRLHHQLMPMFLEYEREFPENILKSLKARGHQIRRMKRLAVVSVISRLNPKEELHTKGDMRRHGANAGI